MRNQRTKRALTAILAVMMLVGVLSGCGKKNENGTGTELSEFVYVPNYATIDENVTDMSNLCCVGDTIYFTARIPVHADGTVATQEENEEQKEYNEKI